VKLQINYKHLSAEFIIIVVGILVALAGEGWRQEREERQLESDYLFRLANDLRSNEQILQRTIEESRQTTAAAQEVLAYINSLSYESQNGISVLNAASYASLMRPSALASATYDELVSSGRLTLIEDIELRAELVRYYRMGQRRSEFFLDAPAELMHFLNRALPPGYLREIQQCELRKRGFIPETTACTEMSLSNNEIELALNALRSTPELPGYLSDVMWYGRNIELPFVGQELINSRLLERVLSSSEP